MLEKKFLIGRRLVVHFPNSMNAQMGIFELPQSAALIFAVDDIEVDGRRCSALVMSYDSKKQEIARFDSRGDALKALNLLTKKFKWSFWRVGKWLVGAVVLFVVLDFLSVFISPLLGTNQNSPTVNQPAQQQGSQNSPAQPGANINLDPQVQKMLNELSGAAQDPANSATVPAGPTVSGQTSATDANAVLDILKQKK